MASDLSAIYLTGRAGKDAELRYTANGTAQARFSLAVSRWKRGATPADKGEEETTWLNVVVWGDKAERISEQVKKGARLHVSGRISIRSWKKDDGTEASITEVVADNVNVLVSPKRGEARGDDDWGDGR